jgi:general secretion pathway protein M
MRPQANADRWRVLGAVALALLVAYLLLVHWWFTAPMLDMGQQIEDLRDQEQALKVQIAQRPELEARLAQVRQFEAANPGFLPESSR